MKIPYKTFYVAVIGVLAVTSLAFAQAKTSSPSFGKVITTCGATWTVALSGAFSAGWNSPITLSSGTVPQLISMMENGCDLKFNVKFANSVGQGAYPNLTFQCSVIEADNESLTCFSPLRYSQYGAIDNQRMNDRVILLVTGGQTQISIMRHIDNDNIAVVEPFPNQYGRGQLRVFAKK